MKTIAFDLFRTFIGAASNTPRGIDRVDIGYATQFFADPETRNIGLLPSPRHMGVVSAAEARRFAAIVEGHWRESKAPGDDRLYTWLRRRLAGEMATRPPVARISHSPGGALVRYTKLLAEARRSPLRPALSSVPRGSVYVNTGQVLLGWSWFFDWLDQRPDVKPVFMMYDLIPVLHPEYSGPNLSRHHKRAVATLARRAAGMIAISHAAADEIRESLKAWGRGDMPIHVTPLPVGDVFLAPGDKDARGNAAPYFVAVGAIDQRKNLLLLLHVWREMAERPLTPIPKLVIVGVRGQRSAQLVDFMQLCPALADSVIEVNGLSTPAMRELIRDARALLMPSFTEGFGLPVVEALALGTPVIASDIPVHREVGGAFGVYLDPLDGTGWLAEIEKRSAEGALELGARRNALSLRRPQTWASYFDQVLPFINEL